MASGWIITVGNKPLSFRVTYYILLFKVVNTNTRLSSDCIVLAVEEFDP